MIDVRRGDLVVTSTSNDAQVYTVNAVSGNAVELYYRTYARWYSGGWSDISIIKQPTRAQLDNYARYLQGDTP